MSRLTSKVKRIGELSDRQVKSIAKVQARGGVAALIQCSSPVDLGRLRRFGVNVAELLVSEPEPRYAEEIASTLKRSMAVDKIVVAGCARSRR